MNRQKPQDTDAAALHGDRRVAKFLDRHAAQPHIDGGSPQVLAVPGHAAAVGLKHAHFSTAGNGRGVVQFMHEKEADIAFQYLFRHANKHMARKIEQSELKPEFLKYFKIALEAKRRRKGRLYAHLGNISIARKYILFFTAIPVAIISNIFRNSSSRL